MNRKLLILNHKVDKFYLKDIWRYYVANLLERNPNYFTRRKKGAKVDKDFYVLTKYVGPGMEVAEELEVMNYYRFRKIIETYLTDAATEIIYGATLKLGHGLGNIEPIRVERNHKKKMINWGETKKRGVGENGKYNLFVYFDDDDWIRIKWKRLGKITNERSYKFEPSEGAKALKTRFTTANMQNPHLKLRYHFAPFIQD